MESENVHSDFDESLEKAQLLFEDGHKDPQELDPEEEFDKFLALTYPEGGFMRAQNYLISIFIFGSMSSATFIYNLPLLKHVPALQCLNHFQNVWEPCDVE